VFPPASSVERGAYVLWQRDEGTPDAILIGSGSEVSLALETAQAMADRANLRVVSMPSWELFDAQDAAYRERVLPAACRRRLALEAGATMGWERYVGDAGRILGVNHFGASAPYKVLQKEYGFTVENVTAIVNELLA
jgi:transketolase